MAVPRIAELPVTLASQIAAGEVIERPAAVIKELLDNSIDAGADEVTVTVVDGGHKLIAVSDNGHGIHPDDIQLALMRHSTSKINAQSDLDCITSLGFRGEALASIAAVSDFLLVSRTEDSNAAWALSFDPVSGNSAIKPAPRAPGTTVEVADIFQATPARRKFMRSRATELLHITDIFKRVACSRFNVSFTLTHNSKTQLRYRACADNMTERVKDVFGSRFAAEAVTVNCESGEMRLWGWLGGSDLSRSQSDRQFCFVNGRAVRDKKILHAVRTAFDDSLPVGRYPTCLLHLDMDPAALDINVHPTKSEIRFRDNRGVHDFIHISLRDALNSAHSLDLSNARTMPETTSHDYPERRVYAHGQGLREAAPFYQHLVPGDKQDDLLSGTAGLGVARLSLSPELVLTQRADDIILLNYRAASLYVLEFRLRQEYLNGSVRRRPLLVLVNIEASRLQTDLVGRHESLLDALGLSLRVVSPEAISVREIPTLLEQADVRAMATATLDALHNQDRAADAAAEPGEHLLTTMARSMEQPMDMPSDSMVQELLNGLDRTDIDTSEKQHKGLWKTVSVDDLSRLIDA